MCGRYSCSSQRVFLFRIHGDHRIAGAHLRRHARVDVLELRVAVGVLRALHRLAVAMEAVVHPMEKHSHQTATGRIAKRAQLPRQTSRALAGPTQRRHGVSTRQRLDQTLQRFPQIRLMMDSRFPSTAWPTHASFRYTVSLRNRARTHSNRAPRDPRRTSHQGNDTVSKRIGFRSGPDAPCMLVEERVQRSELLPNRALCGHAESLRTSGLS